MQAERRLGATGAAFIEGALDLEAQTQSNGVELTLATIERFLGAGALGFENADRRLPPTEALDFDADGWLRLDPGAYKVRYTETVNVPLDRFAIARPRSSLLRMGASMPTALWDSGFRGKGEGLLLVHNPHGMHLRRGARLIQLVFFQADGPSQKPYSGLYQGTGL
ncbi:MAG: deoxyuridine 5'-triphosphate nucleotidohydrolase [Chloroflexota bacterium]|nr:deoxyuridine 5'-triphosphate nucleotidohydrolase [Chloroflexota bacterium]